MEKLCHQEPGLRSFIKHGVDIDLLITIRTGFVYYFGPLELGVCFFSLTPFRDRWVLTGFFLSFLFNEFDPFSSYIPFQEVKGRVLMFLCTIHYELRFRLFYFLFFFS
jgi:hypothetical protein